MPGGLSFARPPDPHLQSHSRFGAGIVLVKHARSPDPATCSRNPAGPRACSDAARGTPLSPAQVPSKARNARKESCLDFTSARGHERAGPGLDFIL